MSQIKTTIIKAEDKYSECIGDSCFTEKPVRSRPKGFVEVYDLDSNVNLSKFKNKNLNKFLKEKGNHLGTFNTEEPIVKKDNLIVYDGREWLATKMFNLDNASIPSTKEQSIYWFGIGSGGAPEIDPLVPTVPEPADSDLNDSIMINVDTVNYGDYRSYPDIGHYKKRFEAVDFQEDVNYDNRQIIIQTTIVISGNDANGNVINEAGLFLAESDADEYSGDFTLFSRITFSSILKTDNRQLVFIWYIYV